MVKPVLLVAPLPEFLEYAEEKPPLVLKLPNLALPLTLKLLLFNRLLAYESKLLPVDTFVLRHKDYYQ